MAWWTKVAAFATIDLAALAMLNGFFGAYLSLDQKAELVIGGVALIPLVLILSWVADRKAKAARATAVKQTATTLHAFHRGSRSQVKSTNLPVRISNRAVFILPSCVWVVTYAKSPTTFLSTTVALLPIR